MNDDLNSFEFKQEYNENIDITIENDSFQPKVKSKVNLDFLKIDEKLEIFKKEEYKRTKKAMNKSKTCNIFQETQMSDSEDAEKSPYNYKYHDDEVVSKKSFRKDYNLNIESEGEGEVEEEDNLDDCIKNTEPKWSKENYFKAISIINNEI